MFADRQTDTLITILRSHSGGGVIKVTLLYLSLNKCNKISKDYEKFV